MINIEQEAFGIYHVYNRGVRKEALFHDGKDYSRFLLLILTLQSDVNLKNISRLNDRFNKKLQLDELDISTEGKERFVELISFCIMPNHFHIMVNQLVEGGLAKYMQKVLTAYTMYYNKKYNKTGHVFQGKYKSVFIEDDEQLVYTFIYIHKNPIDIDEDIFKYQWSSLADFLDTNRWGTYLKPEIVTDRYGANLAKYKQDIVDSPAKEISKD